MALGSMVVSSMGGGGLEGEGWPVRGAEYLATFMCLMSRSAGSLSIQET